MFEALNGPSSPVDKEWLGCRDSAVNLHFPASEVIFVSFQD